MGPQMTWLFPHLKYLARATGEFAARIALLLIYHVPDYRAAAIVSLLTMASSNPAFTNTGDFYGELDIHYCSSTAQQRTNHYRPGRTCGLANRHNRPSRCRAPAWPGPSLASSACSLGFRGPYGLDRRGLGRLGLAGLLGWLFRRLFGRCWRWLDYRLC